jgi:hypothetical protein
VILVNAEGESGSHTLRAEAFDEAGNQGSSATVSVTVGSPQDTTPPAVTITDPTDGDLLSASVTVAASATDDTAVTEVRFYVDGALLGVDAAAPYSAFWDTSASGDGPRVLHAEAFDAGAPTVTFTSPGNGAVVNKNKVQFTVDASSPAGVLYVELLVDGVPDKLDKRAPYVLSPNTKRWIAGPHLITARAVDADGNVGETSITVIKVASESKKKEKKKKEKKGEGSSEPSPL